MLFFVLFFFIHLRFYFCYFSCKLIIISSLVIPCSGRSIYLTLELKLCVCEYACVCVFACVRLRVFACLCLCVSTIKNVFVSL